MWNSKPWIFRRRHIALGWESGFDLVFTSITPAVRGIGLDKIIQMSRVVLQLKLCL
jgi:hypothetical protein